MVAAKYAEGFKPASVPDVAVLEVFRGAVVEPNAKSP